MESSGCQAIRLLTDKETYTSQARTNVVQKFDPQGRFLLKFGKHGTKDGELDWPRGIALDKQGNVYVAEANNCRIQKFDPLGRFLLRIGGKGSAHREFRAPFGITVDTEGSIYVADTLNHRVQKLTTTRLGETTMPTRSCHRCGASVRRHKLLCGVRS